MDAATKVIRDCNTKLLEILSIGASESKCLKFVDIFANENDKANLMYVLSNVSVVHHDFGEMEVRCSGYLVAKKFNLA